MKTIISYLCLFFVFSSGSLFAQSSKVETLKDQLKRIPPQQILSIPLQNEESFRQRQEQESEEGRPLWAMSVKLEFDFASVIPQVDEQTGETFRLIAVDIDPSQLATTAIYFDSFELNGKDELTIITNLEGDESRLFEKTLDANNNSDKGKYVYGFINTYEPRIYLKLTGENSIVKIASFGYIFRITGVNGWNGTFNTSVACIRPHNVNCPQFNEWCDQSRSVFKMCLTDEDGDMFLCSGAMVTNERNDGMPFALTAQHCIESGIVHAQTIYMFNYESPNCANIDGVVNNTVCGSALINSHESSDYAILRLTDAIPKDYDVFFAGWTNDKFSGINDNPRDGAGIHHPNGDIKKVMTFDEKIKKKRVEIPTGGPKRYVWKVEANVGGTEGGSSGSPLFMDNGRIIGQLSGGPTNENCTHSYYGRFYKNWHNYGLSWILNPNGDHSGSYQHYISAMNGFDPCVPNYNFTSANNLHTSAGVTFLNYAGTTPRKHNGVYVSSGSILASQNVQIQNNTYVEFDAGSRVLLSPGFHAQGGSHFLAIIGGCEPECGRPQGSFKVAPPQEANNVDVFRGDIEGFGTEEPYSEIDDEGYEEYEGQDPDRNDGVSISSDNKTAVFIYPNPAITEFAVELSNNLISKIEIYSSKGILLEERVTQLDKLRYTFSTYNEKSFIVVKAIGESDIVIKQVLIKP